MLRRILLPIFALFLGSALLPAQSALRNELQTDRALRLAFETALSNDTDDARRYLPLAAERPWFGEMNFRDSCRLARALDRDEASAALAERLVLAAGLRNRALALRESGQYLPLGAGRRLFERLVLSDPDEAMALASGTTRSASAFQDLLSSVGTPEFLLLARIAADVPSICPAAPVSPFSLAGSRAASSHSPPR